MTRFYPFSYRVHQTAGVVVLCAWFDLNNFPKYSKTRNFSVIKFCDSMEHRVYFWRIENQNCFFFAFSYINKKALLLLLCLQGGNHGLFGNSTAQSRGMHTPVQPLNSSPNLRAQVPPQFISPQVSNFMFPQFSNKAHPGSYQLPTGRFCGHKRNNSYLNV